MARGLLLRDQRDRQGLFTLVANETIGAPDETISADRRKNPETPAV